MCFCTCDFSDDESTNTSVDSNGDNVKIVALDKADARAFHARKASPAARLVEAMAEAPSSDSDESDFAEEFPLERGKRVRDAVDPINRKKARLMRGTCLRIFVPDLSMSVFNYFCTFLQTKRMRMCLRGCRAHPPKLFQRWVRRRRS